MTKKQLQNLIKLLDKAENGILDLPDDWQIEMMEADIDWLTTVNRLSEIKDYLKEILTDSE